MGFLMSQVGGAAKRSSVSAVSRAFEVPPPNDCVTVFTFRRIASPYRTSQSLFGGVSADERWLYSRRAILAKCRRLTQEILLRGLGVLRTTMKLTGRPDLGMGEHKYTPGEYFLCDEARWPHKWKWPCCETPRLTEGSKWARNWATQWALRCDFLQ